MSKEKQYCELTLLFPLRFFFLLIIFFLFFFLPREGSGGSPYNGLYRVAPPKRSTFLRMAVHKRVGISRAKCRKQ